MNGKNDNCLRLFKLIITKEKQPLSTLLSAVVSKMLQIFVLFASIRIIFSNNIFCPESQGDNVNYSPGQTDFGLNIYPRNIVNYAEDCYLRHSLLYTQSTISTDFIDPNANMLVISHGWEPNMNGKHTTSDRWDQIVNSYCVSNANNYNNGIEICEPSDHNAQYWIINGWNVIMLDWRQFANEPDEVKDAEKKIYADVYNGQTVVELLYNKLVNALDITNWNGQELRLVGHSLGAQVVMSLGAKLKLDSVYKDKLTRIALLDHFFSNGEKDFLPKKNPNCRENFWNFWYCARYWTGEYARDVLLPIIRGGNTPAVIENYRTSLTSSNPFIGDENVALNERTVFSELKPWYYNSVQMPEKHISALPIYLHCMKFISNGNLHNNAPSCRMDTTYLKNEYCPSVGTSKCIKRFVQRGDDAAYTTWDYDDEFDKYNV
eukprot:454449_1